MKIIAFSLFGSIERYRLGLIRNIEIAAHLFPDWVCLAYCDEENYKQLEHLHFDNARIILQQKESHGMSGMTWRLNACHDSENEVIIFRDTDSFLTPREKEIVDEWLASPLDVHLIRDHPLHTSPVMGGMFGVRDQSARLLSRVIKDHHATHRQTGYGDDQDFLTKHFYPKIIDRALVHTTSVRYLFEFALPIRPCQSEELFIGAYEFASYEEKERLNALRLATPPVTRLPPHWEHRPILKVLFKRLKRSNITYQCRWCI